MPTTVFDMTMPRNKVIVLFFVDFDSKEFLIG